MAEIFGWELKRKKDETKEKKSQQSFTQPNFNDGAVEIEQNVDAGGAQHFVQDFTFSYRNEKDLIDKYREMARSPEVESAIEDVVNEAIAFEPNVKPVELGMDNLDISKSIQNKIDEEFDTILSLLNFYKNGDDIFRRWYEDGKLYYHKIIDKNNKKAGIQEIRYIDPRYIKKVREVNKETDRKSGVEVVKGINEYFLYNESLANNDYSGQRNHKAIKISTDAITYATSGLTDKNNQYVLSYLHKAIKPYNMLNMLEDSVVIYRLSRAPERRVFYVDVGNLPKTKAEEYVKDIMNKHRNKMVYDASSGSVKDGSDVKSMQEDIWLPRREGSKGTEVSTLQGGQQLGELDDVLYFKKKLYKSLNIPVSRIEEEGGGMAFDRSTEISREEIKFNRFVERLRKQFTDLFNDLLYTQLVLKGIIAEEDWEDIKENLSYHFNQDSHFTEMKESELINNRLDTLRDISDYVGKYFSKKWVQKNVLRMSDDEIEQIEKEIEEERKAGQYEDEEENYGF